MSYIICNKCVRGYIDCFKCDGDGTIWCPYCKGKGDLEHRTCEGTGVYPDSGRPCKRCEGTGRVECRVCEGSRTVSCRKCEGSGKLTCRKCEGTSQVYSPWETKKCDWNEGCSNEISYHKDWPNPPTLCDDHKAEIKRRKVAREAEQAKWHEKKCAYRTCPNTIRWHESKREPDYCTKCIEDLYRLCAAQGCSEQIKYKIFYDNIPEYCGKCKNGEREITVRYKKDDGTEHVHTGKGYINKNGFGVFVDKGYTGKHSHEVYYSDGTKKGQRNEGHEKDFKRDDLLQANCERCGHSFDYPSKWSNPPRYCKECTLIITEERNRKAISKCAYCGGEIEYPAYWNNPPTRCENCSTKWKEGDNKYWKNKTTGQWNKKDVNPDSEGYGEHHYYDKNRSREGYVGPNADRNQDKK